MKTTAKVSAANPLKRKRPKNKKQIRTRLDHLREEEEKLNHQAS